VTRYANCDIPGGRGGRYLNIFFQKCNILLNCLSAKKDSELKVKAKINEWVSNRIISKGFGFKL
jgi:hypothetical protein